MKIDRKSLLQTTSERKTAIFANKIHKQYISTYYMNVKRLKNESQSIMCAFKKRKKKTFTKNATPTVSLQLNMVHDEWASI